MRRCFSDESLENGAESSVQGRGEAWASGEIYYSFHLSQHDIFLVVLGSCNGTFEGGNEFPPLQHPAPCHMRYKAAPLTGHFTDVSHSTTNSAFPPLLRPLHPSSCFFTYTSTHAGNTGSARTYHQASSWRFLPCDFWGRPKRKSWRC